MVKKCKYYILYPEKLDDRVKVECLTEIPKAIDYPQSGFAEGGFKTKKAVKNRLGWINVTSDKRPKGY